MATLVLSTVGTALGGPVGSAIGALIGQSIDQELLAPASRGPRVGDLTVQSSSYGTQIPRVYGTMRVGGSVVWSTDLVEHAQTDGAKGQPDLTYTYSVSFAVALSSRRASSIGRIWADGNLLRGAAGDLKVPTTLRFYDGDDDQLVDPLISSIEGMANTPAYRGLTLAVFEDLQLASFGNRIPVLTFELIGDDAPPALGSILNDASHGLICAHSGDVLVGFAAYGRSIRDAAQPIVDAYALTLFDDGEVLREPSSGATPTVIAASEFGNSADQQSQPRLQRRQAPSGSLPASMRLKYYDPARDFQAGEARASASEQTGTEVRQDLAAALDAGSAKTLSQAMLARSWAARDQLTLRLPPKRMELEPGAVVTLPLCPTSWTVDQLTVDGFVAVAELSPATVSSVQIAGDSGRVSANPDVVAGPLTVALIDAPDVLGLGSQTPTVLLAASSPTNGWKSQSVEVSFGGQTVVTSSSRIKSVLGTALTALPGGSTELIDELSSVDVRLVDPDQWLTSCDDQALAAGENVAVLGTEMLQFGEVTPLSNGCFRLSRFARGRGGTEWATGTHVAGEIFCLLKAGTLQAIPLPVWSIGGTIDATAGAVSSSLGFSAECVRPLSPVDVSAELQSSGALQLNWVRRSRAGLAWIDQIDAPLGESSERYSVVITGSGTAIERTSVEPNLTVEADVVVSIGAGEATVEVRQIGDFGMSRPAQITINL